MDSGVQQVQTVEDLAALLRDLRRRHARSRRDSSLTYRELAARTGWSPTAIAEYFTARTLPPTDRFDALLEVLGAEPAERRALADARDRVEEANRRVNRHSTTPQVSSKAVPCQLPAAPGMFTGRVREFAELDAILAGQSDTLLIAAIGGTGGIGKTWLALHWAYQRLDRFPDGQLYVNLRGFDPSGQPTPAGAAVRGFLDALGVKPATLPVELDAQVARYRSLVTGKRMLILLDNARDVDHVAPLLPGSPTCTVLVTSRRHLTGLAALHGARLLDLDVLPEPDARELLAHHLGSERLVAESEAVAELLAVCAGLPLAVRIVAARAEHHPDFPLAVLAEELRDARMDALDAGDLRVNLRAVLSWSYLTLSTKAANLFRLLGIAPGPDISLPAAACLAGQPAGEVRVLLQELEQASLVQQYVPGRHRMHDLIRLYADDAAHHDLAQDVREAALQRLLDFYTHTAHAADRFSDPHRPPIQLTPPAPGVYPQPLPDASAALAWLDTELAALLAAQHLASSLAWHPTVWQLAWTLNTFLHRQGHRHDLLVVWQAALVAAAHLPDPSPRIIAHRVLGGAYTDLGRRDEGIEHLHQALALAEEHHEPLHQARTHWMLALASGRRGDNQRALEHATRARDLFRALDQPVWEAEALSLVGWCMARLGEFDTARTHCQTALTLLRHHHHPDGEASTLDCMGYIAHHVGDRRQAIECYQQALAVLRPLGHTSEAADTLDALGHPHVALGEYEQARVVWREALLLYQEQGRDDHADRVQQQLEDINNRDGPRWSRHAAINDM